MATILKEQIASVEKVEQFVEALVSCELFALLEALGRNAEKLLAVEAGFANKTDIEASEMLSSTIRRRREILDKLAAAIYEEERAGSRAIQKRAPEQTLPETKTRGLEHHAYVPFGGMCGICGRSRKHVHVFVPVVRDARCAFCGGPRESH